jgi:hypothetical protein
MSTAHRETSRSDVLGSSHEAPCNYTRDDHIAVRLSDRTLGGYTMFSNHAGQVGEDGADHLCTDCAQVEQSSGMWGGERMVVGTKGFVRPLRSRPNRLAPRLLFNHPTLRFEYRCRRLRELGFPHDGPR